MKTLVVGTGIVGVICGWALSQAETKLYYAGVMKEAEKLGFEMPYTKGPRIYLNESCSFDGPIHLTS